MENNCLFYDYITIGVEPELKQVSLYKCCMKHSPNEIIKSYTFDEWKKVDVYSECLNNINNFGKNHDFSISPFCESKGAVHHCFRQTNSLKRVCVYLSYACNANCSFCVEYQTRRSFLKEHSDIRNELKELYFYTLTSLVGKGIELELTCFGEPFFYLSEMKDFLKQLTPSSFNYINIVTNASMIDEETMKIMKDSGVFYVFLVSLNGVDEESYNILMHLKNFNKTLQTIFKLKELGFWVRVSFVVDFASFAFFNKFKDICSQLFSKQIPFDVVPNSRYYNVISEREEFKQLLETLKPFQL